MKEEYRIGKGQAVEGFRSWAKENEEPLQLTFARAEVIELAQQGLGELLRQVGRQFIEAVMEAEVEQLVVGARSKPNAERAANRWGSEEGFCIIDSQRVPLTRLRVRSRANREVALGSYELFQRTSLLTETVWQKIMHGLNMRNYKEVVQQFTEAYGLEKSTVSEHFIEASRRKTVQGDFGRTEIAVPRDRNGSFEPQILPKHERRWTGFDDKIVSMYTRGMSTRDIEAHLREIYGVDVSATLISQVTEEVMEEVRVWQSCPLEPLYMIVYLDAVVVKMRHEGRVENRAVLVAIGVTTEGAKKCWDYGLAQRKVPSCGYRS